MVKIPTVFFNEKHNSQDVLEKLQAGEITKTIRKKKSDYWLNFYRGDKCIVYWSYEDDREPKKITKTKFDAKPHCIHLGELTDDFFDETKFDGKDDFLEWRNETFANLDAEFIVLSWTYKADLNERLEGKVDYHVWY